MQFRFGFPGVRERPIASDFDGDGIDDLGLWAPDRTGAVPQETAEWYVFISAGTPIPNRIVANPQAIGGNIVDFTPVPFGNDLYAQFGDDFGLPVVGNFDPPVVGGNPPQFEFATFTNPDDPVDVNDDGLVTPVDALHIFNVLNRGEGGLIAVFRSEADATGPFYDPSGDGYIAPVDALMVINRLNSSVAAEAESAAVEPGDTSVLALGQSLLVIGVQEEAASQRVPARADVAADSAKQRHVDTVFAQPLNRTDRVDGSLVSDHEPWEDLLDELAGGPGRLWWDDSSSD